MEAKANNQDWRGHRTHVLETAKRVVIKVGSAVLTDACGLDLRVVNRLADQIAGLHDKGISVVLVSSGAVAAGRRAISGRKELAADLKAEGGLPALQAVSAIGQSRLMHEYDEAFGRYRKTTAQILLTKDDFIHRERFLNARNTVRKLLDWRVIPVINENDSVAVAEFKFGDNDFLSSMVLSLVEADLYVNLTSTEGVFEENPSENPAARCMECIEDIAGLKAEEICRGKTDVGTGGMYSKLLAAKRASQLAVPTLIVSGKHPFALEKAFNGEDLGTWIMPEDQAMSKRKYWLAYHSKPSGEIWVDPGAANALTNRGKSLLAAGIVRVEGDFDQGGLVRILDHEGQTIGVGLTNYDAGELRLIMGRKSADIERVLGRGAYTEAVHRDNMVLDPAI